MSDLKKNFKKENEFNDKTQALLENKLTNNLEENNDFLGKKISKRNKSSLISEKVEKFSENLRNLEKKQNDNFIIQNKLNKMIIYALLENFLNNQETESDDEEEFLSKTQKIEKNYQNIQNLKNVIEPNFKDTQKKNNYFLEKKNKKNNKKKLINKKLINYLNNYFSEIEAKNKLIKNNKNINNEDNNNNIVNYNDHNNINNNNNNNNIYITDITDFKSTSNNIPEEKDIYINIYKKIEEDYKQYLQDKLKKDISLVKNDMQLMYNDFIKQIEEYTKKIKEENPNDISPFKQEIINNISYNINNNLSKKIENVEINNTQNNNLIQTLTNDLINQKNLVFELQQKMINDQNLIMQDFQKSINNYNMSIHQYINNSNQTYNDKLGIYNKELNEIKNHLTKFDFQIKVNNINNEIQHFKDDLNKINLEIIEVKNNY